MLAEKMNKHGANAWLINTGWSGGKYGEGKRMDLKVTRAIIDAIHSGELEKVPTKKMDLFGLQIPETCPGVPSEMLNPRNTWKNKSDYDTTAKNLAALFVKNFNKYADKATQETKAAGPQLN
jgi:phosphoenolpyruvate carboxykinase (ATP)